MQIITHYQDGYIRVVIKKSRWKKWRFIDITHKEFDKILCMEYNGKPMWDQRWGGFIYNLEILRRFLLTFNESEIDRFFIMIRLDN